MKKNVQCLPFVLFRNVYVNVALCLTQPDGLAFLYSMVLAQTGSIIVRSSFYASVKNPLVSGGDMDESEGLPPTVPKDSIIEPCRLWFMTHELYKLPSCHFGAGYAHVVLLQDTWRLELGSFHNIPLCVISTVVLNSGKPVEMVLNWIAIRKITLIIDVIAIPRLWFIRNARRVNKFLYCIVL